MKQIAKRGGMEVITTAAKMQNFRASLRGSVGFVPTMGALHEGHMSLIRQSIQENDNTIVSIYVNPTQFLPTEDLQKYSRQLEKDIQTCKDAGADVVFAPQTLYGRNEISIHAPKTAGYVLEGHFRPGHFDGVLQVVLKLFNITLPHRAYFGKKDAQQYILIQKMVSDLFMPVSVIGLPTCRDSDGLAKSSRNVYLSSDQRQKALSIFKALEKTKQLLRTGTELQQAVTQGRELLDVDRLQYFCATDYALEPLHAYEKDNTLLLTAGFVGGTRLIDNMWL